MLQGKSRLAIDFDRFPAKKWKNQTVQYKISINHSEGSHSYQSHHKKQTNKISINHSKGSHSYQSHHKKTNKQRKKQNQRQPQSGVTFISITSPSNLFVKKKSIYGQFFAAMNEVLVIESAIRTISFVSCIKFEK